MSHWLDETRVRQDVVTIPRLWVTIAASVLIHVAILFIWIPRTHLLTPGDQEQTQLTDRLQVRLESPPTPPPSESARPTQPSPPSPARPPRTTVARIRPPPVALPAPEAPVIPVPPPPPPVAAAPPKVSPPITGDLAAYVEARRRERGEQAAATDSEAAQFNRAIAANLPAPARGVAAQDSKRGGGIFQIKRMTYDDAAFEFYGWNTAMGRKTPQLIEVRKGDNADMRIAVVRRMIAIIRQFEKEDFTWESPQKGTIVVLSARLSDNAALEKYLMHEFFDDGRGP
jgi:type IV secretory pathway VirB10-like protein